MSIKERISKAIFQCPYSDEIQQDVAGLKAEMRILSAKCHKIITAIEVFMSTNPTQDNNGTMFEKDLKPLVTEEASNKKIKIHPVALKPKKVKKNVRIQNTPRGKSSAK